MRISDWSSDVCSSDLGLRVQLLDRAGPTPPVLADGDDYDLRVYALAPSCIAFLERLGVWCEIAAARSSPYQAMQIWEHDPRAALRFDASDVRATQLGTIVRSEERRVGKAGVRTCRSRWSPYH